MNNRLAELKKPLNGSTAIDVKPDATNSSGGGKGKQSPEMVRFFKDVEIVKDHIMQIQSATKQIDDIKQEAVLTTTSSREKQLSAQLEPLIQLHNKKAASAKQMLLLLRSETEKQKQDGKPGGEADIRIRDNLANTLTRKFVDVMKEYQNAQQKYKTEIKKKVRRQVQIVKPDASSEEIDAVLKSGGGSGEVFKNAILKGDASETIRNTYMTVQDKYQDVLTLEASVQELHQMFMDFALLVDAQGELLEQIEFQVKQAGDYVEEGNTNMVQAIEYAKQVRKQQLICVIIILVVIGVILAIMAMQGMI